MFIFTIIRFDVSLVVNFTDPISAWLMAIIYPMSFMVSHTMVALYGFHRIGKAHGTEECQTKESICGP